MPTEIINIITCLKIKYRQRHHNSKQRIVAVAFGSFDCLYILYVSLDLMNLVSPVRSGGSKGGAAGATAPPNQLDYLINHCCFM
jgi:hypothetical protein